MFERFARPKTGDFLVEPTKNRVTSLKEIGLNKEQRRQLFRGESVNWQNPSSTIDSYEFFIYKVEKDTFSASILSIQNRETPGVLKQFVLNAERTAKNLGCKHLEINGISVEPRLSKVMQERYGFSSGKSVFVEVTSRNEPALSRTFDLSHNVKLE